VDANENVYATEQVDIQCTQTTMTNKKTKNNTICIGDHHTKDEDKKKPTKNIQHNMCWTPSYTRHKTKTNKTKNTTQGVSCVQHIMCCGFFWFFLSSSCVLCMMVSNTYYVVFLVLSSSCVYRNTLCVEHNYAQTQIT
jgi:hypothetical protein